MTLSSQHTSGARKFAGEDTEADLLLSTLTGRDFSHVRPRRPNLRAMVRAISKSGEHDASLAAQLAHQSFGDVSNAAVHTSLIGLVRHLHKVDEHYCFVPTDGSHATELLVAALAVSDMVNCQARQASNAAIDEMNRDLLELSIEVFRERGSQANSRHSGARPAPPALGPERAVSHSRTPSTSSPKVGLRLTAPPSRDRNATGRADLPPPADLHGGADRKPHCRRASGKRAPEDSNL